MNNPSLQPLPSYENTLDYLYDLQRIGIKFGLTNISKLLEELGQPQTRFKSLHIAGTNGKGSTSCFIHSILQAAGYRTGLYTSPHLIDFCERIKVNSQDIPQNEVVRLTGEIREALTRIPGLTAPLTFFEIVTALAFRYFAEAGVAVAVVETGMGGRLDATNVINPLVSVITNLGLEHEQFLGYTLEEIAGEKAGIIKPEAPLVTGVTQPQLLEILQQTCAKSQVRMHTLSPVRWQLREAGPDGQNFDLTTPRCNYSDLNVRLLGDYQLNNAALVVRTVELADEAGLEINEEAIRQGLAEAVWPGRLQVVSRRPYIVLDGAHNPPAAHMLADNLRKYFRYDKLILVIGILKDKNQAGILEPLVGMADIVILSHPDSPRAATPEELKLHVTAKADQQVLIQQPLAQAIKQAQAMAGAGDLICVTGSLYTVGEALAILDNKSDIRRVGLQ